MLRLCGDITNRACREMVHEIYGESMQIECAQSLQENVHGLSGESSLEYGERACTKDTREHAQECIDRMHTACKGSVQEHINKTCQKRVKRACTKHAAKTRQTA